MSSGAGGRRGSNPEARSFNAAPLAEIEAAAIQNCNVIEQ